jgi:hypothetical protein
VYLKNGKPSRLAQLSVHSLHTACRYYYLRQVTTHNADTVTEEDYKFFHKGLINKYDQRSGGTRDPACISERTQRASIIKNSHDER